MASVKVKVNVKVGIKVSQGSYLGLGQYQVQNHDQDTCLSQQTGESQM